MILDARPLAHLLLAGVIVPMLGACVERSRLAPGADDGPNPELPAPQRTWLPTVVTAPARGWPEGAAPEAASGLQVSAFATGLSHPRWLSVLPNGDVLVAESNAPKRPEREERLGLKGQVMTCVMKRAGAGVPSADRITLLRDADGDGRAERRSVFLASLHSPFGMALVGDQLYVANTDAVLEFHTRPGDRESRRRGARWSTCRPGRSTTTGPRTSSPAPTARGSTPPSGSNSNVAENGLRPSRDAPPSGEIDRSPARSRCLPPACAIPTAWPSPTTASCGPWSTSATSSAAIWCPTT